MSAAALYVAAAIAEIAGCFAFWAWLRLDKSALWLIPGTLSLMVFAWVLALSPAAFAGRAYAAYGGVYIAGALAWLIVVEGHLPDRWDVVGTVVCIAGSALILWGPRA